MSFSFMFCRILCLFLLFCFHVCLYGSLFLILFVAFSLCHSLGLDIFHFNFWDLFEFSGYSYSIVFWNVGSTSPHFVSFWFSTSSALSAFHSLSFLHCSCFGSACNLSFHDCSVLLSLPLHYQPFLTGHFFHCMAFLEKGEGLVLVYVFLFLIQGFRPPKKSRPNVTAKVVGIPLQFH